MQISYSQIEVYLKCPKRYYFSYVEKIKPKKSKEQIFGNAIHLALKFLHQPKPLPPTLSQVLDYFKEVWEEESEKVEWDCKEEKEAYFKEGVEILKEYYQKNHPKNFLVVALEKKLLAKLKESPHPEAKEHTLVGIVDRIDKLPEGMFEIIDYKTHRKMPSQNHLQHNLQLGIYALAFEQNWPAFKNLPLKLSLYFLKHSEKLSVYKTTHLIEKTKQKVLKVISLIEKKKFPPFVSEFCDYCSYRNICPMWKHLYEDLSSQEREIVDLVNEYLTLKKRQEEDLKKIKKLREEINRYCDQKGIERIFGDEGYLKREYQTRTSFDFSKVKELLEPLGLWNQVLEPSSRKLKEIWDLIPEKIQEKIEKEAKQEKVCKILRAVFKKVKKEKIISP